MRYFSKTIALAKINYLIHDKEMLAIVKALQYQRAKLESTKDYIKVVIDHKAFKYFMSSKLLSTRQACQAKILSQYNFKILYKPRKLNKVDLLTRIANQVKDLNKAKQDNREQALLPLENLNS